MEEDAEEEGKTERGEKAVFVDVGESSGVGPSSAFPDGATAKPGRSNTTNEIIVLIYYRML
jgi:hypothetical protein